MISMTSDVQHNTMLQKLFSWHNDFRRFPRGGGGYNGVPPEVGATISEKTFGAGEGSQLTSAAVWPKLS